VDYEHWRKESQIWTWAANCVSHMNSKIDKDVMTFRGQVGDKAEPPTLNTVSLKWAVRMHGRIPREGMRSIGLIKSGGRVQPMCVGPTWVVVDEQGMVRVGETLGLFKSGRWIWGSWSYFAYLHVNPLLALRNASSYWCKIWKPYGSIIHFSI
jgi:hypothetical protein